MDRSIYPNKYRNVPTEVYGKRFASQREAERYGELRLLEKAGEIQQLQCQHKFPLHVNRLLVCTYIADFTYNEHGKFTVEDVKPRSNSKRYRSTAAWQMFRIKYKLMQAIYGITIRIV